MFFFSYTDERTQFRNLQQNEISNKKLFFKDKKKSKNQLKRERKEEAKQKRKEAEQLGKPMSGKLVDEALEKLRLDGSFELTSKRTGTTFKYFTTDFDVSNVARPGFSVAVVDQTAAISMADNDDDGGGGGGGDGGKTKFTIGLVLDLSSVGPRAACWHRSCCSDTPSTAT